MPRLLILVCVLLECFNVPSLLFVYCLLFVCSAVLQGLWHVKLNQKTIKSKKKLKF